MNLISLPVCVVCGGNVQELLGLGNQYLTDFLDAPDANHPKAPLKLMLCTHCWLTQLDQVVDRDALFRNYHYRSGVNAAVRRHLEKLAQELKQKTHLLPGDVVVDIGANDGTFMENFPQQEELGFEPALNLALDMAEKDLRCVRDFFSADAFRKAGFTSAKGVASIAMFYDLVEPTKFACEVAEVLDHDGIWVCEMNYLGSMLRQNAFDFVGHEHVAEYSVGAFQKAIAPAGLELVDVSLNDLNGGSARYWIAHKGAYPKQGTVGKLLNGERYWQNLNAFERFKDDVKTVVWELGTLIRNEVKKGKEVWVKGASTRGMTLLQTAELNSSLIEAACDANPLKVGKYMAGLNIPVRSLEDMREEQPDYLLVLPWSFADEFIKQEHDYLKRGGRVIIPLPTVRIVSA